MSDPISNQFPIRPRQHDSPPRGINKPEEAPGETVPEQSLEDRVPERLEFPGVPPDPELLEKLKEILNDHADHIRGILGNDPPRKVNVGSFPWR
ncbi:MAG: hypothetical protein HYU64_01345 [Armatimonadetes bacterium]|nr:hypothetical protein [Armatimonadota bacterium]